MLGFTHWICKDLIFILEVFISSLAPVILYDFGDPCRRDLTVNLLALSLSISTRFCLISLEIFLYFRKINHSCNVYIYVKILVHIYILDIY